MCIRDSDLSATEQEEFRIRCRSALEGLETLLQSLLEISKMGTGLIQINKKKLPLMDTVISEMCIRDSYKIDWSVVR